MDPIAPVKLDPATATALIVSTSALIAVGLIAAAVAAVLIARAAYISGSAPDAARSFGLIFHALPSLTTIVFIVLATATLTALGILPQGGCIAIFSSIASYVLGAETQKRREV